MKPVNAVIRKIIRETPTITTLKTDLKLDAKPGQFVMAWIRGLDEVPMALSSPDSITVQKVGEATSALCELQEGDSIGLRGPFGNGFELKGSRIMIIAGGVGGAPLLPLAKLAHSRNVEVTALIGAKMSVELLFESKFSQYGSVGIATDDGSKGHSGVITGLMNQFDLAGFDQFYVCGPEMMMKAVLDILHSRGIEQRSQFSLHRYFKCGIGICGSCTIDPSGLRVCRDGPVFRGELLLNSELGRYRRDSAGKKVMF